MGVVVPMDRRAGGRRAGSRGWATAWWRWAAWRPRAWSTTRRWSPTRPRSPDESAAGLRVLYVALTRATQRLTVLCRARTTCPTRTACPRAAAVTGPGRAARQRPRPPPVVGRLGPYVGDTDPPCSPRGKWSLEATKVGPGGLDRAGVPSNVTHRPREAIPCGRCLRVNNQSAGTCVVGSLQRRTYFWRTGLVGATIERLRCARCDASTLCCPIRVGGLACTYPVDGRRTSMATVPSVSYSITVRLEVPASGNRGQPAHHRRGVLRRFGDRPGRHRLGPRDAADRRHHRGHLHRARRRDRRRSCARIDGVAIGKVSDRTFLMHLGGKIEMSVQAADPQP